MSSSIVKISQFDYGLHNFTLKSTFLIMTSFSPLTYLTQNFPQSHQLITTLNGSVPTTQTLTTTAAFNNINSSSASGSNYTVSEDEISKKLPKEILLRILSYLDVVSLCRCAQVSIILELMNMKETEMPRRQQQQYRLRTCLWLRSFIVVGLLFHLLMTSRLWNDDLNSSNITQVRKWVEASTCTVTLLINSAWRGYCFFSFIIQSHWTWTQNLRVESVSKRQPRHIILSFTQQLKFR